MPVEEPSTASLIDCQLRADCIEKLENCGLLHFRYWSKTSKTTAKFARPDSQTHKDRDDRKLAAPSDKNSKTLSMRREFLDQGQMGSFSTEQALISLSLRFAQTFGEK
jgi:hypothetical protein